VGTWHGSRPLFIRGGESTYTKVLGMEFPSTQPGERWIFSSYCQRQSEPIEVVRGRNLHYLVTDAMTGVVQMLRAVLTRIPACPNICTTPVIASVPNNADCGPRNDFDAAQIVAGNTGKSNAPPGWLMGIPSTKTLV